MGILTHPIVLVFLLFLAIIVVGVSAAFACDALERWVMKDEPKHASKRSKRRKKRGNNPQPSARVWGAFDVPSQR